MTKFPQRPRVETGDVTVAVLAIARGDDLAYFQAVGFQDRAKTIPMKLDSIFWIASMTKPIPSVAAMILVEDGRLDLDAPVTQYLPRAQGYASRRGETDPATGKMEIKRVPPERPMTVRDLQRQAQAAANERGSAQTASIAVFASEGTPGSVVRCLRPRFPQAYVPREFKSYL